MNELTRTQLIRIIKGFKPKKIMVAGDMMLDQYTWGKVNRISPEAPIPILSVEREEFRPGGAASVVANVSTLDCQVFPVGYVGNDPSGDRLMDLFSELKTSTIGLERSKSYTTIVKKRVLTHQQQLLRIDYESSTEITQELEKTLQKKIEQLMPDMDGVIISDYAKGVITQKLVASIISLAKKHGIPVTCDPGKGVDYSIYQGVSTIKPNRSEAELAVGFPIQSKEEILKAAKEIKNRCNADFVSLSLDRDGILYFENEDNVQIIETEAQEVFDVTGAGDMVTSVIGVLLAHGVSGKSALKMANLAAEIEISHLGVVPLPWSEMLSFLNKDSVNRKIITLDRLLAEFKNNLELPLVFTNGYFDRISAGHLRFLIEFGQIPGRHVVAINSDQAIKRKKGNLPLLDQHNRARLLASLENIDHVLIFDEDDAGELIKKLAPKIIVKGDRFKGETIPEEKAIQEVGAKIEYIQHFSPVNKD